MVVNYSGKVLSWVEFRVLRMQLSLDNSILDNSDERSPLPNCEALTLSSDYSRLTPGDLHSPLPLSLLCSRMRPQGFSTRSMLFSTSSGQQGQLKAQESGQCGCKGA